MAYSVACGPQSFRTLARSLENLTSSLLASTSSQTKQAAFQVSTLDSVTPIGGRFTARSVHNNTKHLPLIVYTPAGLLITMASLRFALLFAALLGVALCGALPAVTQSAAGRHSNYQRPPAVSVMPVDHHLLKRHSRHPHAPEQIATALSGPGTLSISWVRHSCTAMAHTHGERVSAS
jgi:hypothetical protein